MTRTLEERETLAAAGAIKRREGRDRRLARKAAASAHIRVLVESKASGRRRPRQRDNAFLQSLRRLPCIAGLIEGGCAGTVEAAHLRFSDAGRGRINSGMQAKPDDKWSTPLCNHHHQHDQHKGNERAFWARLGIDPGDLCEALYAAFLAGQDGEPVVRRFAQEGRP